MHAAQATLKHYSSGEGLSPRRFGATLDRLLTRIFGCWHTEMGRPLTHGSETYRACLGCGASRRFDTTRWEMVGDYYYRRAAPLDLYSATTSRAAARRFEKRASLMQVAA